MNYIKRSMLLPVRSLFQRINEPILLGERKKKIFQFTVVLMGTGCGTILGYLLYSPELASQIYRPAESAKLKFSKKDVYKKLKKSQNEFSFNPMITTEEELEKNLEEKDKIQIPEESVFLHLQSIGFSKKQISEALKKFHVENPGKNYDFSTIFNMILNSHEKSLYLNVGDSDYLIKSHSTSICSDKSDDEQNVQPIFFVGRQETHRGAGELQEVITIKTELKTETIENPSWLRNTNFLGFFFASFLGGSFSFLSFRLFNHYFRKNIFNQRVCSFSISLSFFPSISPSPFSLHLKKKILLSPVHFLPPPFHRDCILFSPFSIHYIHSSCIS